MDVISTTGAVITSIAKTIDYVKSKVAGTLTDTSLSSVTKLTRAEPLTIISNDCANLEELPDIMEVLTNIYCGYFLQAVAIMTRVNDIEVIRILDRLNPDRDSTGFLLQNRYATENITSLLKDSYKHSLPTKNVVAVEAAGPGESMVDSQNYKTIYEVSKLATGKLLNVSITTGNDAEGCQKTVNIPVSVRLCPALLNDESLAYLFTNQKTDTGLVERYHSWRTGRIRLIQDMIFCQDMIREYRRAAIKDRTGTLQEIIRRVTNARAYGLLANNPSMAVSSNIYVLSKASAHFIEAKTGERFSSPKGREKILADTYAMIVAIVDSESGIVTFYFDGIAYPSTIHIRSLKSGSSKGPDIADVMRTLMEGRAPTF